MGEFSRLEPYKRAATDSVKYVRNKNGVLSGLGTDLSLHLRRLAILSCKPSQVQRTTLPIFPDVLYFKRSTYHNLHRYHKQRLCSTQLTAIALLNTICNKCRPLCESVTLIKTLRLTCVS